MSDSGPGLPADDWDRAILALELLAADPEGLGGLWLRARSGPVRDRYLAHLQAVLPDAARIHPGVGDEALHGGIDLAATLGAGAVVQRAGLLSKGGPLILTMAERCGAGLAARLGQALDARVVHLVALDEAAGPEEGLPNALAERLGLFVDLGAVAMADATRMPDHDRIAAARARLVRVTVPDDARAVLATVAARLGITSLRAPSLSLAAARANAALAGRDEVKEDDLAAAVALVLAHRGAPPPEAEAERDSPSPDQDNESGEDEGTTEKPRLPEEILLDAAKAALPADLLAALAMGRAARAAKGAGGAGATRKGNRRGRPLPSRPGRLDGAARIDLVATLRAAAPFQAIRRQATGRDGLVELRPDDIRLKRYQETSDRLLIFAVDASGSAALARLAEAKGAVELLLAEAYVRRDHVALIAFRGQSAEVLLPPTRSLVQTKRRLGGLPGGGATPLAAGLRAALDLALQARVRGLTPTLALLTDGRANVSLDGTPDRTAADADAARIARAVRAAGIPAVVIDTASRPQPQLAALARVLAATYLPLPRADAARMSSALSAAIGA